MWPYHLLHLSSSFQEQKAEDSPMFERSYVWSEKYLTHRRPSFLQERAHWETEAWEQHDGQWPLLRGRWRPVVTAVPPLAELCCHAGMYFINRHQPPPGQRVTSTCISDQTSLDLRWAKRPEACPAWVSAEPPVNQVTTTTSLRASHLFI